MFLFGELIKFPFIHLLASYSSANHLTLHPFISLARYFYAIHLFGELFSCQPFNFPSIHWRVIFVSSIPWESYFRVNHLILHPSIVLKSYFCSVHPLGELFSCKPFNCPIPLASYFLCHPSLGESYFHADHLILHPLASYFNVYHINSPHVHPFGELFLCHPSLGRAIFVPTI